MADGGFQKSTHRRAAYVGRKDELAYLLECVGAAGGGEGGLVLINGEPGIGKTRLLAEVAARAREAGWLVLSGQAYDAESTLAYLPFIEALRQHVEAGPELDLLEPLRGISPLLDLIPGLQRAGLTAEDPQPLPPDAERLRVFNAISECFLRTAAAASGSGLFLGLDDLHWADRSSLLLLQHLARKLSGARLLIVGTYRVEAAVPSTALSDILAALSRERLDTRIALGPLSEAEAAALMADVSAVQPSAAVLRGLYERTRGNPFFVEEVVLQMLSEGRDLASMRPRFRDWRVPELLREIIEQRLSRLTPDAQRMLQAASVIGDSFPVRFLGRVSGRSEEVLVQGLEELAAVGVLREGEAQYSFSHPLMREAVYSGISLARRQQLHTRAAEALQERATGQTEHDLAVIGQHWRLGSHPERAVACLLGAGDASITLTAWTEAAEHWQSALECMEQAGYEPQRRARLLEGIGDLYFLSRFDVHECIRFYERAVALYESVGDALGGARAKSRAGRSLAYPTSGFDYAAAVEQLRDAEKVLGGGSDSVELGEVYAALAHAETHQLATSMAAVEPVLRRLEEIAEKLDNEYLRVISCSLNGHYHGLQGKISAGLALEERASSLARAFKAPAVNQWPQRWREFLQGYSSEIETIDPAQAGSLQATIGFQGLHRQLLANLTANCCGLQSLEILDPVKARAQHELCRNLQGEYVSPLLIFDLFASGDVSAIRGLKEEGALGPVNNMSDFATAFLSWADGRWIEADQRFREIRLMRASNSTFITVSRLLLRLHRLLGEDSQDMASLQDALAQVTTFGAVKSELPCRAELALLLAEAGRLEDAEQHLLRCRDVLAAGEDWRGIEGRIALAEAVLAAAQRRREDAEARFEHAVEVFQKMCLLWDEAEAYELWAHSVARFLRGQNRRAFVSDKLAAARGVYQRIGAGQAWFERLLQLERQSKKGKSAPLEWLPEGLSARQAQVLRLIAEGKTNGEIADELVISLRTVERHVAELYAKIGVRNRVEAAAFAMNQFAKS